MSRKKAITYLVGICLVILINAIYPYIKKYIAGSTDPIPAGSYKVVESYDGDTIGVDMAGKLEKIRMIGVDTPETHKPNTPVQCYGPEASEFTKSRLLGTAVRLEADFTNDNRDRYNRLLRYVYTQDGTLWNKQLVREGYGFAYLPFPFLKKVEFMSDQFNAAKEKKGLWGVCDPVSRDGRWQSNYLYESEE